MVAGAAAVLVAGALLMTVVGKHNVPAGVGPQSPEDFRKRSSRSHDLEDDTRD